VARPSFRIVCCLCAKPIPKFQDVFALDAEWQRRFPKMNGTLACARCALHEHYWDCEKRGGGYVAGHIRAVDAEGAPKPPDRDHDSWCHVGPSGTHMGMVLARPESGLIQGAEECLRYVAQRPGADRLRALLAEWDKRATSRREQPAGPVRPAGC
jgi:hypothetical protein